MGFNTPILVLNDALHRIKNNPVETVEAIQQACNLRDIDEHHQRSITNGIRTVGTAHADQRRILVAGGNTMIDLAQQRFKIEEKTGAEKQRLKQKAETVKREMEEIIREVEESEATE